MASVVDICNSALNLLGASTISSLTEDSKNARLCNQRYEPIRNRTFRSHAWNFATKRVQLAKDSTAPVVEFANQYTLPSDCLRVLKVHTGTTDSIKDDLINSGGNFVDAPAVVSDNLVSCPHYKWMGQWMLAAFDVYNKS